MALRRLLTFSLLALQTPLRGACDSIHLPHPHDSQQVLSAHTVNNASTTTPRRIAIIGAGSAGSSAAYFLSRYFSASNLATPQITIYERNSYIGGRSTTLNVFDDAAQPVELGASIFVKVNHNLVDAANAFNLSTSGMSAATRGDGKQVLGIWDGEKFVITQTLSGASTWEGILDKARLLLRYGLAPLRVISLMKETVSSFLTMYDAPIFPFDDLTAAAQAAGLLQTTGVTGTQLLEKHGLAGLFATEVVQASTRVNYAQNLAYIHGLEAMVCMATDGAMSVKGGNWRIFKGMVDASGAELFLNTSVSRIQRRDDGRYTLTCAPSPHDALESTKTYDAVILAAPSQFASLDITPAIQTSIDTIPYVTLHVTLFTSPHGLSPAFFNLAADADVPDTILTTLPADAGPGSSAPNGTAGPAGFFSISTLQHANNPAFDPPRREYLYKIFGPSAPSMETLHSLLGLKFPAGDSEDIFGDQCERNDGVTWLRRKVWQSYPYLKPRVTFEQIGLDGHQLWYTSGIESFISTMETSSLMGKNVARLVFDRFVEADKQVTQGDVT